jgi:hypothetical protein
MIDEPMTTDQSTPLDEGEDTIDSPIPWFFMDEDEPGLRAQAGWLEEHLDLSDGFFARFLRIAESSFRDWRLGRGEISSDRQDGLRRLWRTVRHLLSFMGMDQRRVKTLLRHLALVEATGPRRHPLAPPWAGSSLMSYLEERGPDVLPDVDYWVAGFRFGNPYAS